MGLLTAWGVMGKYVMTMAGGTVPEGGLCFFLHFFCLWVREGGRVCEIKALSLSYDIRVARWSPQGQQPPFFRRGDFASAAAAVLKRRRGGDWDIRTRSKFNKFFYEKRALIRHWSARKDRLLCSVLPRGGFFFC